VTTLNKLKFSNRPSFYPMVLNTSLASARACSRVVVLMDFNADADADLDFDVAAGAGVDRLVSV
jgi:hypothetical protein